jgi:hypothetical protein
MMLNSSWQPATASFSHKLLHLLNAQATSAAPLLAMLLT